MYPAYFLSFVVHGAPLRVINVKIAAGPLPAQAPMEKPCALPPPCSSP